MESNISLRERLQEVYVIGKNTRAKEARTYVLQRLPNFGPLLLDAARQGSSFAVIHKIAFSSQGQVAKLLACIKTGYGLNASIQSGNKVPSSAEWEKCTHCILSICVEGWAEGK